MTDLIDKKPTEGYYDPEPRFGACPYCCRSHGYINVRNSPWFLCDTHMVRWCTSSGMFSDWQDENEEIWEKNVKKLEGYTIVEPIDSLDEIIPQPIDKVNISGEKR